MPLPRPRHACQPNAQPRIRFTQASATLDALQQWDGVRRVGASVPATNIWGNEAATHQKLKLLGGLLGGMASLVGAGVDSADARDQHNKGRAGLAVLHGLKAISGAGGGLLTLTTSFSYGPYLLHRLQCTKSGVWPWRPWARQHQDITNLCRHR